MDGYLNKAEASAEALGDGRMHTGDVAFMDSDGWFYIVDRKKDMISASGYKVLAFVALIGGSETTAAELIAFCRDRIAAYKAPRCVEILAELPKTVTGKIMRAELRRTATAGIRNRSVTLPAGKAGD